MSGPPGEAERFLLWVRSSQDTVEVKQAYVDTADDFVAEIVFRRIVYCRRPSRDGRSRSRVKREENPGLVKGLGRLVRRVQRQPRGSAWPPPSACTTSSATTDTSSCGPLGPAHPSTSPTTRRTAPASGTRDAARSVAARRP